MLRSDLQIFAIVCYRGLVELATSADDCTGDLPAVILGIAAGILPGNKQIVRSGSTASRTKLIELFAPHFYKKKPCYPKDSKAFLMSRCTDFDITN